MLAVFVTVVVVDDDDVRLVDVVVGVTLVFEGMFV